MTKNSVRKIGDLPEIIRTMPLRTAALILVTVVAASVFVHDSYCDSNRQRWIPQEQWYLPSWLETWIDAEPENWWDKYPVVEEAPPDLGPVRMKMGKESWDGQKYPARREDGDIVLLTWPDGVITYYMKSPNWGDDDPIVNGDNTLTWPDGTITSEDGTVLGRKFTQMVGRRSETQ